MHVNMNFIKSFINFLCSKKVIANREVQLQTLLTCEQIDAESMKLFYKSDLFIMKI